MSFPCYARSSGTHSHLQKWSPTAIRDHKLRLLNPFPACWPFQKNPAVSSSYPLCTSCPSPQLCLLPWSPADTQDIQVRFSCASHLSSSPTSPTTVRSALSSLFHLLVHTSTSNPRGLQPSWTTSFVSIPGGLLPFRTASFTCNPSGLLPPGEFTNFTFIPECLRDYQAYQHQRLDLSFFLLDIIFI